jgi:plastocyanin domain-containing protein
MSAEDFRTERLDNIGVELRKVSCFDLKEAFMKRVIVPILFIFLCFLPAQIKAETAEYKTEIGNDGVQKVEILATSYSFAPKHIIVKVNVPVEISAKKEAGIVPHNITLNASEAGIDFSESLSAEPITIKFTPAKAGTYTFYCNKKVPFSKSHREKGMEGILEVRE